jgi:hypothetical protein
LCYGPGLGTDSCRGYTLLASCNECGAKSPGLWQEKKPEPNDQSWEGAADDWNSRPGEPDLENCGVAYCEHYPEGLPVCSKCREESQLAHDKACALLAEARADAEHWKGECSDLVRMAHEMRAEIDYFQTLIDLQHKRTVEADKLWQVAHNQPNVLPDLGELIGWLMKRADDMRCCYNCKYGPMCSVDARVCSGCSFAHNNPADGQMRWEAKP